MFKKYRRKKSGKEKSTEQNCPHRFARIYIEKEKANMICCNCGEQIFPKDVDGREIKVSWRSK